MECPRCGLNNMPGSAACFQCGADLLVKQDKPIYYPPRASKKGIQSGIKRHARSGSMFENLFSSFHLPPFTRNILHGFLSIIPGLAQFINKQPLKGVIFSFSAFIFIGLLIFNIKSIFFNFLLFFFLVFLLIAIYDGTFFSIPIENRKQFNQ